MLSLKYTNLVEQDLDDAISHIASQSIANSMNYLARYEKKIELLKLNPLMGAECRNKLIKRECRALVHESHIIIYKVLQDADEILIVRIFHVRESYQNKIN